MVPPIRILAAMGLLVLSFCALAKDDPTSDNQAEQSEGEAAEAVIEEVVVTGTRITRRDFNTPSPLTTIGLEDIEFTPQATLEETLNQMPQVFPSNGRTSNLGNGMANVDLRGLGPGRSLVLLNGRRLAPTGTGNEVDLNNIPRFLIERVEIITGGTSAVYGSDAIAGVVNFITFSDYQGLGFELGYNTTGKGDAQSWDASVGYGHNFANGRGNIIFYANWFEREEMLATERAITSDLHWDGYDGNLYPFGSWSTPAGVVRWPFADFGSGPANVTFLPDGTPREFDDQRDAYNYSHVMYLQVPLTRLALGAMGNYDLSDRFEGYFEASFARNEPALNLAPTPAWINLEINLDNPVLTPEARQLFTEFYGCAPNLACISLDKRFPELGQRLALWERDYARVVAGFRGELGKGWDIDGWVTYTKASDLLRLTNAASRSRYLQGMLVDPATGECYDPSGGCVPLDVFGENNLSPDAAGFLRHPAFENETERSQKLASVFVTGSPFDTWAGPLDTAFGIEWRSDDTDFKSDDAFLDGDVLGWAAEAPITGVEDVFEIYGEALIPLASAEPWADYLELELGARYSRYDLAGDVETYKAGGTWQPFGGLRLRAMYQRSVRAPNSSELFEEQSLYYYRLIRWPGADPCSASADPVGSGVADKCIIQGLPADQIGLFEAIGNYEVEGRTGGNPDLKPETGETRTLGAVVTPASFPNWFLSVDWFSLEVTDTIGGIDSFLICFDENNTAHVFCENVRRDASGNIARVTNLTNNRGVLETTGIDTQIQYAAALPERFTVGDHSAGIGVNLHWTHLIKHKVQENPASEVLDCAGYFGWPCAYIVYPENRVTTSVDYNSGPLGLHLTWRWIEGTDNAAPLKWDIYGDPEFFELAIPDVANRNYLDFGVSYDFGEHYQARFGIGNLLDTDPPQMAEQALVFNTDVGMYDVFGRSYYLRLSAQF